MATSGRDVRSVVRRLPFTLTVVTVTLLLGVATGTLWSRLSDKALLDHVAYGLPALDAGRWWTVATGAVFAISPAQYVPVLTTSLFLVGFTELRFGTLRAMAVCVGMHLVGVLGAAGFLALASGHGWAWADATSRVLDVGFSAGALGGAAAATVTLPLPWRGRARAVLLAYALVAFLYIGALWDLEHLIAIVVGLAIGPLLAGRHIDLRPRVLSRHEYRLLAAGAFAVTAAASLLSSFAPSGGPLTVGLDDTATSPTSGVVFAVIWGVVADGLRRGRRRAWLFALGLTAALLVLVVTTGVVLAATGRPGWPVLTYTLLLSLAQLVVLVVGRRAFRNPSRRRARRTPGSLLFQGSEDDRAEAIQELRACGTVNHLAWMTTWPENRWFAPAGTGGYVAYRVHAGVAIGLCDPVAAGRDERSALLASFADSVQAEGLLPCLFSVTQEAADHAASRGWQALQVAEEAFVDLGSLEFRGKAWQDVRTALNKAAAAGVTHQMGALAELPRGIQVQVRAISEQWIGDKGLPEMGFTLGGVDEAMDPHVRVGLAVDGDGTVHGVTSWMPVPEPGGGAPRGWTLDVMRRLPGGFRHSMEFLIASACLAFREEGAALVSLSGVPLARAGAGDSAAERGGLDAFLDTLGATLEPYYGFRSLQAFKAKFSPTYAPLYLVFPEAGALPRIGVALSRAYLPEAGVRDLVSLTRGSH